jgi:hypothetical protein
MSDSVTAFAPASIGNVGVGFDMLGLALADVGDRVIARRSGEEGITIGEVRGLDGEIHPYLSVDPTQRRCGPRAAMAVACKSMCTRVYRCSPAWEVRRRQLLRR